MDDYLENAISLGLEAFWESISESYPDVKNGDMEPETVISLEKVMRTHVKHWLKNIKNK